MLPLPPNLIAYGIVAAVVCLMGITIKHQYSEIASLENEKAVWTNKNKELADKIEGQNTSLREAETKYSKTQRDLDIASGKNQALSTEYKKLRDDWKTAPPPKTCEEAVVELRARSSVIAERWNKK
jgi:septal ring factor EnvC (AmiA/AmiB activator)